MLIMYILIYLFIIIVIIIMLIIPNLLNVSCSSIHHYVCNTYIGLLLLVNNKLVNNNLPHYFSSFTPQFSAGQQNYNLYEIQPCNCQELSMNFLNNP